MTMVLKVCGMGMLVLCTSSIGMALARALTARVEELRACLAAVGGIESELSYSLAPPGEIIGWLEERESLAKAAFLPACASLCRGGMPFPLAWRQAVKQMRGNLTPDDLAVLESLGETLGQRDLESQLAQLSHVKELLQLQLASAGARAEGYAKLYRTMGVLAGAFLVIVLI